MLGSKEVYDPWSGEQSLYADEVYVSKKKTHSKLLGPDGNRLEYKSIPKIGFAIPNIDKD